MRIAIAFKVVRTGGTATSPGATLAPGRRLPPRRPTPTTPTPARSARHEPPAGRARDERGFTMFTVMMVMLVAGLFVAGAYAASDGDLPARRAVPGRQGRPTPRPRPASTTTPSTSPRTPTTGRSARRCRRRTRASRTRSRASGTAPAPTRASATGATSRGRPTAYAIELLAAKDPTVAVPTPQCAVGQQDLDARPAAPACSASARAAGRARSRAASSRASGARASSTTSTSRTSRRGTPPCTRRRPTRTTPRRNCASTTASRAERLPGDHVPRQRPDPRAVPQQRHRPLRQRHRGRPAGQERQARDRAGRAGLRRHARSSRRRGSPASSTCRSRPRTPSSRPSPSPALTFTGRTKLRISGSTVSYVRAATATTGTRQPGRHERRHLRQERDRHRVRRLEVAAGRRLRRGAPAAATRTSAARTARASR